MIAFGSVVIDDIEYHLDPRPVQRLYHVAELIDRPERVFPRTVGRMGCEERDRCIAPVILESLRSILLIKMIDRQQFDRGNAEILQIWYLFDQACVGPPFLRGNA